jgi:hypothetical protein
MHFCRRDIAFNWIGSVKDAINTTLMECGETFLIDCEICTDSICVAVCKKTFGKCAEKEKKKLYKYYCDVYC